MSDPPMDTWKVLYNLFKREYGISEKFQSIDDIICKQPSFLRPYSKNTFSSRFQDTFLIWLINELITNLNENISKEITTENVELQKRILLSCLFNRQSLFVKLVTIYIKSIDELAVCYDPSSEEIILKSFSLNDTCLQQIDSNFEFKEIKIKIEDIDGRIKQILSILHHAVDIGFENYPKMFIDSLEFVLEAIAECGFSAKISCINYCCVVFEKESYNESQRLNYFYVFAFKCVQVIWERIQEWLLVQCIDADDVNDLISATIKLFSCIKCLIFNCDKYLLMHYSSNVLKNLTMANVYSDEIKIVNFKDVRGAVISYIINLLDGSNHQIYLSLIQFEELLSLAYPEPRIFRIFAVAFGKFSSERSHTTFILDNLLNVLAEVVQKENPLCYIEILKEILRAFSYIEHIEIKNKQLQLYHDDTDVHQIAGLKKSAFEIFQMSSDWTAKLKSHLSRLVTNIEKEKNSIPSSGRADIIELIGIILRTEELSNKLDEKQQIYLIDIVQQPLRHLTASNIDQDLCRRSIYALSNISLAQLNSSASGHLAAQISDNFRYMFFVAPVKRNELSEILLEFVAHYLAHNTITRKQMIAQVIPNLTNSKKLEFLYKILKLLSCTLCEETVFFVRNWTLNTNESHQPIQVNLLCEKCDNIQRKSIGNILTTKSAILLNWQSKGPQQEKELLAVIKRNLIHSLQDSQFCFAFNHFNVKEMNLDSLLNDQQLLDFNPKVVETIVSKYNAKPKEEILDKITRIILRKILISLQTADSDRQKKTLELINKITNSKCLDMSEEWLYHFFKMTFFYLMHCQSEVVNEAILCATEMCMRYGVEPITLWDSYRRDLMNFMIKLAIHAYLTEGIRLTRSLKAVAKLLGFSCVQVFISTYYRMLTTMILPYCVKEDLCKGLIVGISKTIPKSIPTIFLASFLRIYSHIFLTETAEIGNKCIDLLVKCTGSSLHQLMHADVKQTVAEFLVYLHRNPELVMKAFQCLLLSEGGGRPMNNKVSTSEDFAKFIADRFLGIIIHFEGLLRAKNYEKSLKEEILYSLGKMMRFVGPEHVTQFRFKIIAMLSSVLTVCDKYLQKICLRIWNIFLHIVNIEALGPSLSRIVASLQPLLAEHTTEINDIYKFLILNNDNLLGSHIPDLYFIEQLEFVLPEIKQCVARQTESILKGDKCNPLEKLNFLYKQITKESLQVRIYGLMYLDRFFASNRIDINNLIIGEIELNPLVERIIENLVACCKHEDRNLQLASAKCLGELGAVDPSYMPLNYSSEQNREFSFSIHTDAFAIMALTELCRAYQFQKDARNVDCFSLAIQEILQMFGVCPTNNKKMNVWEAIPPQMRQIMEPLLKSCYTTPYQENECKNHPIFDVSRSYEDWAYVWASRLIEFIKTEDTKYLLKNFKPSIRRDNNTLVIFFPYILLHALKDCNNDQMQIIFEEFNAVFIHSSRGLITYPAQNENLCNITENMSRTCTKLCSEQIDFLQRWIREWLLANCTVDASADSTFVRVKQFLQKFDKVLIAKANYNSGEYVRALMYLESQIEENIKSQLQMHISFLIEIHGQLMDSDSVEGAVHIKKSKLSLTEEILVSRIVDRPQDTIACYEQILNHSEPIPQKQIRGMIDCYLRMEIPETALLITDGLWDHMSQHYTDDYFKECKAEVLWRLGRYDDLEELLRNTVDRKKLSNWNVQCAEAFLLIRQPQSIDFSNQLDRIRANVLSTVRTCSNAKHNPYPEMYDEIVKLHLLTEVEKNKQLIDKLATLADRYTNGNELKRQCKSTVGAFFTDWDARLSILQQSVRVIEPILCFRRNLLVETKSLLSNIHRVNNVGHCAEMKEVLESVCHVVDIEIGKLWIRSVQLNYEAGALQQAHLSIMKAEAYQPISLFIEKAKLHWQKGEQTKSLKLIEENLETLESHGNIRSLPPNQRYLYAEAKFLQATFNAESMNICSDLVINYFKEAISAVSLNQQSDKFHVRFAQYMDKIWETMSQSQKENEQGCSLLYDIMVNYAKSMKYTYDTVYQSLPRLLSIWLDYTSNEGNSKNPRCMELCRKMNDLIARCSANLSTEIFYTAFSQLLSRIGHPSTDVYGVLKTIIISLIEKYPHQSLWMLLPFLKSSHTVRSKRCGGIFADNRLNNEQFQILLKDFNVLIQCLIDLTNAQVTLDKQYKVSSVNEQLPKLFKQPRFSKILLPFEKFMQVFLPPSGLSQQITNNSRNDSTNNVAYREEINPFPYRFIYIVGIKEDIVVLRSQAFPKKINLCCSDGKEYSVMLKPKDDLRKDFRLMEFNALLKRYLYQDSQARHRRLRIRTYAVVPFNEECGLIQWLPNLNSYRGIVLSIYKSRNLGISDRMIKNYVLPKNESIAKIRKNFISVILAKHPPVFHEWFKQRFTNPHSWYEARSSYVKTIAVMSMVGYILGLGDRHGENILLDETNGDAVHVDFNCLFNQGETFAVPEVVPFRLTHNMVYAMGPLGIEGLYRKCCEITLRLLKAQTKTLLSVLRPFVYDLVSWNRNSGKKSLCSEVTDPKAMSNMKRIEERLQGYVNRTETNSLPLSTEGQVNFLIEQATNIDNLAAMYIGWGAYF